MEERFPLWRYVAGAAAARTGDEMSGPALLLAGLAVTGSTATASALLAGITAAAAVGGPVLGVLLDRSARPGRLLGRALGGYACGLAAVVAGLGHAPFAVTLLTAVCAGLLGPALSGGWTAQLPRVVRAEDLRRANALDAMTFNAASLVGPGLAGILAATLGARAGAVVAAALICSALPAALALPGGRPPDRTPPGPSIGADLAAGLRAVLRSRTLARATAASVFSCTGQGVLAACVPLLGTSLGAAGYGALLLSVAAASALTANALLARRPRPPRPDTVICASTAVLAGALVLLATGRPVLLVAGMAAVGLAEGPQLTSLFAVRHREAPEHLRGQVFTTGASVKITGFALGAGIAGLLAQHSLPGALLTAAGIQLLAAACFARRRGPVRPAAVTPPPGGPTASRDHER